MTKPTCDLQQQVNWQYPERKPLLTWDIKARNYNTIIMECFFAFTMLIAFSGAAFAYWLFLDMNNDNKDWFTWPALSAGLGMFLFFFCTFYPWTHPRKTFVYRCTAEGFEVQSWNDIAKWKTIAIVVGIVLVVAILALASVFPEALLGLLIGPPLMGLFYYRLFMSKSYWDMQKDFSKRSFDWSDPEIIGLSIDKRRFIVTLFVVKKGRLFNQILSYKFHIFCPQNRLTEISTFFRQQLPHVEYKEGRADVYSHEC